MPRYSIRVYFTYNDEYEVEAESLDAANSLVDSYEQDTPTIQKVCDNQYNDYDSTYGNEIDAQGMYIGDVEEL